MIKLIINLAGTVYIAVGLINSFNMFASQRIANEDLYTTQDVIDHTILWPIEGLDYEEL